MAARLPREKRRQIERDAWELRQQFWTDRRIAEKLGVNAGTICRMLARVEKRLAAEFAERAEEIKARQTVQLEFMARDAFAEYERSKLGSVTVKVTSDGQPSDEVGDAEGDGAEPDPGAKTETTTKGQTGDPALLAQARGALADIRKIWGLDSPEKKEIGGAPNRPVVLKVLKDVSTDEL